MTLKSHHIKFEPRCCCETVLYRTKCVCTKVCTANVDDTAMFLTSSSLQHQVLLGAHECNTMEPFKKYVTPKHWNFIPRAAKSRHRPYRDAKWFEGTNCLFSKYSYTFLRGKLLFILVVVRGNKEIWGEDVSIFYIFLNIFFLRGKIAIYSCDTGKKYIFLQPPLSP